MLDLSRYFFNPYAIAPLATGFLIAVLGFVVVFYERASRISLCFFALVNCAAVWLMAFGGAYFSQESATALRWVILANSSVVFIPSLFYIFTLTAVQKFYRHTLFAAASVLLSCGFFWALMSTDDFVTRVERQFWGYYPRYGLLTYPFLAFFSACMVTSLRLFWLEVQRTKGIQRSRYRVLFWAFLIAHLACVDFFAAYGLPVYPAGYAMVFVFVILMAWGIRRYRLIEITPSFAANEILNTVADALLVIDHDGVIRVSNIKANELLGGGKPLAGRKAATTEVEYFRRENLARVLWSGRSQHDEEVFLSPGKGLMEVEISSSPIRSRRGDPLALVCNVKDITARKQSERDLAEREQRYRLLAENVSDVIWTMDRNLRFVYISPSIQQLTGFTPEEAVGRPLEDTLTSTSFNKAVIRIRQMQAMRTELGPETGTLELEYVRKDGSLLWTEVKVSFLFGAHGSQEELIGVTRDITARKKAEDALSASHQSYESLMRVAAEPIIAVDRLGLIQFLNPAAENVLGYSSSELLQKHVDVILAKNSVAKTLQEFTLVLLGWKRSAFELQLKKRDDEVVSMEANPMLVKRSHEESLIQVLFRDLRRQAWSASVPA